MSKLNLSTKGNYWSEYNKLEQHSRTIQKDYLKDLEFCDLKAYDIIFENIPENSIIHYGNSSVVRYSNLFDLKRKKLTAFANRGTSGIDGSLSTAVGYATKSDKINTLIIGDISFIYDSNGLWNNKLPKNLRIIVINNGGGGIFDIIDGAKDSPVNQEFLKCEVNILQKNIPSLTPQHFIEVKTIKELAEVDNKYQFIQITTYSKDNAAILGGNMETLA